MVVDSSVLLAILQDEPERARFIAALVSAGSCRMSVASFVESCIVIEARFGAEGIRDLDLFIERANIELSPVDLDQAKMARYGFSRYGKGRHRAGLNYGDCFSYALARVRSEPLLFKGDDFTHTDMTAAIC